MTRTWVAGTVVVNPATTATLVETGTLNEREHHFAIYLYMSQSINIRVEEWNGGVAIKSQIFQPVLGVQPINIQFDVTKNSTVRVVVHAAVNGTYQASIIHD